MQEDEGRATAKRRAAAEEDVVAACGGVMAQGEDIGREAAVIAGGRLGAGYPQRGKSGQGQCPLAGYVPVYGHNIVAFPAIEEVGMGTAGQVDGLAVPEGEVAVDDVGPCSSENLVMTGKAEENVAALVAVDQEARGFGAKGAGEKGRFEGGTRREGGVHQLPVCGIGVDIQ